MSQPLHVGILSGITKPIERFIHAETSSGVVLLVCGVLALILANSPLREAYHHFWEMPVSLGFGANIFLKPLHFWINDGLMVVFFFVVGLEMKRELLVGELSSFKKATLPVIAALGGMVVPALLYTAFNVGTAGARGWGIPMATDIAFALGIVALMGDRVPFVLKVFLAALAIADDIGAVLVIALFYTAEIHSVMLLAAAGVFLLALAGNAAGVRSVLFYFVMGVFLWLFVLSSGIHPTIAGVLLALTIPAKERINADDFVDKARRYLADFVRQTRESKEVLANAEAQTTVRHLEYVCEQVQTPLARIENNLHAWVAFGIMPLFALANAGVSMEGSLSEILAHPTALGIILGLVLGKPLGIMLFCWCACRLRWAYLPDGVNWYDIGAIGTLAGIGFTMSLFVQGLAFSDPLLSMAAKVGIFAASLCAGMVGYVMMRNRRTS